jgi:hypothetical protein
MPETEKGFKREQFYEGIYPHKPLGFSVKSKFIKKIIKYDGSQLSSHFAYRNFSIPGNSIIAFIGPVDVSLKKMVDIEDIIANETIKSDEMLNFIIEIFITDLAGTICLQRLFISIICEELNTRLKGPFVRRDGDDLYYNNRKLSVSIATASPVSTMIHSALNIKPTGAPLEISCLNEIGIAPEELGHTILNRFSKEFDEIEFARIKVNWVG